MASVYIDLPLDHIGSGTVTSVGLSAPAIFNVSGSPVTTSGTLALSLANESANMILAGPTLGAAMIPTFRALVAADLPAGTGTVTSVAISVPTFLNVSGSPITTSGTLAVTLSGTALPIANGGTGQTTTSAAFNALSPLTTNGDLLYGAASGAGTRLGIGSSGNVLTVTGGLPVWAAPATSGTVTSVALSAPTEFTVSGSPVTTTGTLTFTKANQNINIVYAGPSSGGAAAPAFRSLVTADMPAGTGTVTSVAMSVPSFLNISGSPITSSGTLAVTLATETANTIFSGPTSGGAATPTFRTLVTADLPSNPKIRSFGITVDGGGSAITTGVKGYVVIPYGCTITGWTVLADQTGSIVLDVWKDTYANFPPTVADTITGADKPTISAAQKGQNLTLTLWTIAVTAGDTIGFNVDSCSTITRATLIIQATAT